MKLYIYRGLKNEKVPKDVTHVIVDSSVIIIKQNAFSVCEHLVSIIMGDNVKRIEYAAFRSCRALRFIGLSKTLEHIGYYAFFKCESLEALFLPSTVKSIEYAVFGHCRSLRLFILPHGIDLSNVGKDIICGTNIEQIAENAGVTYEQGGWGNSVTVDSTRRVNEWLIHHMDETPFHKLCYNSPVTTKEIVDYLNQNGNNSALVIDTIHGMTPLHMLSMNPRVPEDVIAALLNSNTDAIFCLDHQQKTPLEYARDYNVGGLVGMINCLCNHRYSSICVEVDARHESSAKRRRTE